MGLRLCGMALLPFWPFGERFFGFEHFGSLQVPEFDCPTLDARSDKRKRGLEFGVNVALNNLRGDGRGTQTEFLANVSLDAR